MKTKIKLLISVVLFSALVSSAPAAVWNVPGDSATIEGAIDLASYGDTIYVAAGTYVENITLKNGVALIGAAESTTTIDGNDSGSVVTSTNCDPNTILQGFTVTNGNASDGGGMDNSDSSPTVTNCIFIENDADFGGGMWNSTSSNPTVINCEFVMNRSQITGAGMYNSGGSTTVTNCEFSANTCFFGNGGGMYNDSGSPIVTDCIFSSDADYGGGMYNYSCSPIVTNCTFLGNTAVVSGGGMYNYNSSPTVLNCTFSNNVAQDSCGGMYNDGEPNNPTVTNCVFWSNSGEIVGGAPSVTYSNVQGGFTGAGNIDADPLFDNQHGDYRLGTGSPCIDAGNNFAVPAGITTDLRGVARFLDDANTVDSGSGTPPIVDMGAHEYDLGIIAVFAEFTAAPNPAALAQIVSFDASGSYCYAPPDWDNSIISYEWDFDYDGESFDVDGTGVTITHAYGLFGFYNVALKVTDDHVPANTDIEIMTVEVSVGNLAPSADGGGPYTVNQSQSLTLDASASTPGADEAIYGDEIALYEWDLDNDGAFDNHITTDAVSTIQWSKLSTISRPIGSQTISLRVTDMIDLTDSATTTLTIISRTLYWTEDKLLASDGNEGNQFGASVSIDGDTAIVGSPVDDTNGYGSGSAYIYQRNGDNWSELIKLTPLDHDLNDGFGSSVSIDGDYAVVGASGEDQGGDNSGAVYVFYRHEGGTDNWGQQAKLIASDAVGGERFGGPIVIDGDTMIIGAKNDDDNGVYSGSAYIFERDGSSWNEQVKLLASDGAAGDGFGTSVSISSDTAIIGAYGDDDNGEDCGSAYIFHRDQGGANNWGQFTKLMPADIGVDWKFGTSVSIDGDCAIVGAPGDSGSGASSGASYIFCFDGTNWNKTFKMTSFDVAEYDNFGGSVFIEQGTAIIGARGDDGIGYQTGSAYIFKGQGTSWYQHSKLIPAGGTNFDYFGHSVSICGNTFAIGAYLDEEYGDNAGAAYIFDMNFCPVADLTGDCFVGIEDVAVFALQWLSGKE